MTIWSRLLDWLLFRRELRRARQAAKDLDPAAAAATKLGMAALREAERLAVSPEEAALASSLDRSAVRLFIRARAIQLGLTSAAGPLTPLSCPEQLRPPAETLEPTGLPADWFDRYVVEDAGEFLLPELSQTERRNLTAALTAHAWRLAGPLHEATRGTRTWLWRRTRRLLLLATPLVVLLGSILHTALKPHNWARGAKVSVIDEFPNPHTDPAGLVDGDQLEVGFHTTVRTNSWVVIDLGQVRSISRVEIFNRRDCCHERAVPLLVQGGLDEKTFVDWGSRQHSFTHWTLRLAQPQRVRFIRLERKGRNAFHLAEVEAY